MWRLIHSWGHRPSSLLPCAYSHKVKNKLQSHDICYRVQQYPWIPTTHKINAYTVSIYLCGSAPSQYDRRLCKAMQYCNTMQYGRYLCGSAPSQYNMPSSNSACLYKAKQYSNAMLYGRATLTLTSPWFWGVHSTSCGACKAVKSSCISVWTIGVHSIRRGEKHTPITITA